MTMEQATSNVKVGKKQNEDKKRKEKHGVEDQNKIGEELLNFLEKENPMNSFYKKKRKKMNVGKPGWENEKFNRHFNL